MAEIFKLLKNIFSLFSSVPEFVHSVAAQLSQSPAMKSYYQLVMSDSRIRSRLAIPMCTSDPDGSFIQGILEPLKTLQGQGSLGTSQCIILIDGLVNFVHIHFFFKF